MLEGIKKIYAWRDYIIYRTLGSLIADGRKYFLSYLWWVIDPLLEMFVYIIVFNYLLQRGAPNYPQFLLVGLTTWRLFANSVIASSTSLVTDRNVLTVVYLPKSVPPAVIMGTSFVKYLFSFLLLIGFLTYSGFRPSLSWLLIPWIIGNVILISYGLGCIFASLVPFMPDLRYIINTGLRLSLFLSGIFFDIRNVLPAYAEYLFLNPMASLIHHMRLIMLENTIPDIYWLSKLTLTGIIVTLIGISLLEHLDHLYLRVLKT